MAEIDTKPTSPADEIAELKRQMEQMQERLAQLSAAAEADVGVDAEAAASLADAGIDDADAGVGEKDDSAADAALAANDDAAGAVCDDVAGTVCDEREEPQDARFGGEPVGGSGGLAAADARTDGAEDANAGADASRIADEPARASDGSASDYGVPGGTPAFSEGPQAVAAVESVPAPEAAAPQASSFARQEQPVYASDANASQGYAAYVPPAAPTGASSAATYPGAAASSARHSGAGAPTPPPAYDATAAYANQGGASAPRVEYAQPTGQQAYQSGTAHAPGYGSPSQAAYNPYTQTYYQQPVVRTKDHVAAGLLGIFLGTFGIHKFYLGYSTAGLIMLGVAILGGLLSFGLATMIVWLIGLIEGIIYLVKSQSEFEQVYAFGKREWF